jgi:plasmid stabilization system protein ParE
MKVRYIPRAQDDVDKIYESIAANNLNRAQRVEHAIRSAVDLLGRKPGLGVATGHEDARRWPMPEYAYAIFYRIDWDADAVDVLRVVDGRRVRNLKRVPR